MDGTTTQTSLDAISDLDSYAFAEALVRVIQRPGNLQTGTLVSSEARSTWSGTCSARDATKTASKIHAHSHMVCVKESGGPGCHKLLNLAMQG